MKKFWKQLKRSKGWLYIIGLIFILLTGATGYFLYMLMQFTNVENIGRLIGGIVIILLWIFLSFKLLCSLFRRKTKVYIRIGAITLIYSILLFVLALIMGEALTKLGAFSTNKTTYSSSIVTLSTNKVNDVTKIGTSEIGMLKDKKSVDGYEIPQQVIKDKGLKNKIKYYDSYTGLVDALLDEKIDYVFLPTNYVVTFRNIDSYKDIESKTKIIYTQKKEIKSVSSVGKKVTEPFTVLLMGVDSEEEDVRNSSYNGDSLMLVTFNPKTLNTTIMSIPRDTYVPIACFPNKRKNKITHAAAYGDECMMNTISGFTGVPIDYYVKINFKGVVKLVDTLGGVDVDVPFAICEQNSNREWGDNTVYIKEGFQTLNGEQALAWARHREEVFSRQNCSAEWVDNGVVNDFERGQNQQEIVKALLNKLKNVRDLDTLYRFLDSLGNTMVTNMSRDQILSLYNVAKDIMLKSKDRPMEELLSMQKLYISGYDQYIYDYSQIDGNGMGLELYNFVPYKQSLNEVISAMKVNLGKESPKIIKEFSFNVEDEYDTIVIGKGEYSGASVGILPDFTGESESYARAWASKHGINIIVKETTGSVIGRIVDQNLPSGMDIDYVRSLTIYVVTSTGITEEPDVEEEPEETPDVDPGDEDEEEEENPDVDPTDDAEAPAIPGMP